MTQEEKYTQEIVERFIEVSKRMKDEDYGVDVSLSVDIDVTSCRSGYDVERKERY